MTSENVMYGRWAARRTGRMEEIHRSDGKQELQVCTECFVLLEANGDSAVKGKHEFSWLFFESDMQHYFAHA